MLLELGYSNLYLQSVSRFTAVDSLGSVPGVRCHEELIGTVCPCHVTQAELSLKASITGITPHSCGIW